MLMKPACVKSESTWEKYLGLEMKMLVNLVSFVLLLVSAASNW